MAYGYLISFHEFSHSTLHSLVCHATKNFQPLFKDQSGKQKVTNSFSRADLTNYYTDVSYTITFVKTFFKISPKSHSGGLIVIDVLNHCPKICSKH